jgi:hypothetical protein
MLKVSNQAGQHPADLQIQPVEVLALIRRNVAVPPSGTAPAAASK